jgi:Spherulation-specific family 4
VSLGIPAYGYPGSGLWEALASLPAGSLVILDPADGPGRAIDARYVEALASVARRGVRVFGYLTTAYGERTAGEMVEEVRRYQDWYRPHGIFLDQTPTAASANGDIMAVIAAVRAEQLALALNPGQPDIDPEDARVADLIINFEGPLSLYRRTRFPSWTQRPSGATFWHLVYEVGDAPTMRRVAAMARRLHAGVVYMTDATMPNPWERVPAYWEDELAHLKSG